MIRKKPALIAAPPALQPGHALLTTDWRASA